MLRFLIRIPIYLFCFRAGRRLLFVSFLTLIGLALFNQLGPQRFKMSPIQKQIGNDLVRQAVDRFPWDRDVGTVMLVTDRDAWAPFFTDTIRKHVTNYAADGGRKFDIVPDGVVMRLMRTLGLNTTRSTLSTNDIRRICARMEADTLLLVRCGGDDYVEDAKTATGSLSCQFYQKSGELLTALVVNSAHEKRGRVLGSLRRFFERMNVVEQTVWTILGIVLFPFALAPLTLLILRRHSVRANALMVLGYSLSVFTVVGLCLPPPDNVFEGVLWCCGGIAVVWYVLATCDLIASPSFKQRMKSA